MRKHLAVAAALLATLFAAPAVAKSPKVGQLAPDFRVETYDGSELTLADLRGQVVVINLWATWCGPCRTELPLLDTYARVQKKHGFQVIAVTTEGSAPVSKLKPIFKNLEITGARRMRGPYRPIRGGVPTSFVIDRAGVLRFAKLGAFSLDEMNKLLVPLLKEPAPEPAPTAPPALDVAKP
jgi:cytochrome c biogenesis protein CcmG/thiol:disulfide interchange protein DsbE